MKKDSVHPKVNSESFENTLFNFNYAFLTEMIREEIKESIITLAQAKET